MKYFPHQLLLAEGGMREIYKHLHFYPARVHEKCNGFDHLLGILDTMIKQGKRKITVSFILVLKRSKYKPIQLCLLCLSISITADL